MFTLEAQFGFFILLMIYLGVVRIMIAKFEKTMREFLFGWTLCSIAFVVAIDIIAAAIYLIAGWWQL